METQTSSAADQAQALAKRGDVRGALSLLEQACGAGDGDACYTLAMWRLSGQVVPRDLSLAQNLFQRAAVAGDDDAETISIAFLAHGSAGQRDWTEAVRRLQARAGRDPLANRQLQVLDAMDLTATGDPVSMPEGERLSQSPDVTIFRNAFSRLECEYLAEAASSFFRPSDVVDPQTGKLIRHPIRTSDLAAFPLVLENPAVHALNRRIAALSGTTPEQGEPLQVLRYRTGQQYRAHFDALPGTTNQRVLTMLVYLNHNYQGGETLFIKNGLKVSGRRGDALLFRNADDRGRADPSTQHSGMPVTRGVKLIASRWIRAQPLDLSGRSPG